MTTQSPPPLNGIRVLDFSRVLAGPFCTMILADMGADVIKIESFQGDDTRQWGPPWFEGADGRRESAYFLSVNRSKRSVALNLKHPKAQDIARKLAARSQIVLENFKPGGMSAFGLGFEDLIAVNPSLVYGSITGYGQYGLFHDRPGYDFVTQAESGLMSITGEKEGEPHKVGVAISDVIAGLFAASSLLAALRHAEHTGQGQHVDIALLDTTLAALVNIASNALVSGQAPPRFGNAHPSIVPYQTFNASDKSFAIAVGSDRQFAALCKVILRPELAEDPRFATNPDRVQNREALIALLQAAFAQHPAEYWVSQLLGVGVPAGHLNDVKTILNEPQVASRGLIHEVELFGGLLKLVGAPVQFSLTPPVTPLAPPSLGQHTAEVLSNMLGLRDHDIAALQQDGAILL